MHERVRRRAQPVSAADRAAAATLDSTPPRLSLYDWGASPGRRAAAEGPMQTSASGGSLPERGEPLTFSTATRPGPAARPRQVEFERLPRSVQDRFVAVTRGDAAPTPLFVHHAPRPGAWLCVGASALLAIATFLLLRAGYGEVGSSLAMHGPKMRVVDAVLLAAVAYGLLHAASMGRAVRALPYRTGTFVFPGCVVEAYGPVLRVWPIADADAIETRAGPTPALALRMRDGTRVVVPARSVLDVAHAVDAIVSSRPALMRALAEGDGRVPAELDPLHQGADHAGPTASMTIRPPAWVRFDWAPALGAGALLAVAVVAMRNEASDEAMFRSVAASRAIADYERYLSWGGKHSHEIRDVLLPRAELRRAEAAGTVEAVRAVARAHPTSSILPEIDAALRRALRAQLERAKSAGTVRALDEFSRRYPDADLDAELRAARHALYEKALADWQSTTHPDATTTAWMERLLAWAEQRHDPTLEVRFELRPSKTLADADAQIRKSAHYPGPDALPSRYLTDEAMKLREQRLAAHIERAVARHVPPDVLSARPGKRIAAGAPAPALPTLVIAYTPSWAFTTTACARPDTVFPGLSVPFEVTLLIPGGPPLAIHEQVWRIPEPWRVTLEPGESREHYEQRVYDRMIDGAFEELEQSLPSALFRQSERI
jgi:hypothetical protein